MCEMLLSALWRASWQGSLVILLLWCVCRLQEKRLTADARCWLWRLTYVKLLLGLVISGSFTLAVLPAVPSLPLPIPAAVIETTVGSPVLPTAGNGSSIASLPTPSRKMEASLSPVSVSGLAIVCAFYGIGVGACMGRILRAGLQTRRMLRTVAPVEDAEATAALADIAARIGLTRVPHLLSSSVIEVPVYSSGIVLLPRGAAYLPGERHLILAHELAHARRRDLLWEWLGTLTQALFFFHPLVRLARHEERVARESAADALALQTTSGSVAVYGRLLLSLSLALTDRALPMTGTIGAIERGAALRRRLLALKELTTMSNVPSRSQTHAAALATAGLVLMIPWRITQAASMPPSSAIPDASATEQRNLPDVYRLPLIPLAQPLGLTPDQKTRIIRLQHHTAQMREKISLEQTVLRRQVVEKYLPGVKPAQQTTTFAAATKALQKRNDDWKVYRDAMHHTIEMGQQKTRRLRSSAYQELNTVLTQKQRAALPALFTEAQNLQIVGIPVELYSDLNLSADQKSRIAFVVQESNRRRHELIAAIIREKKDDSRIETANAKRGDLTEIAARRKGEAQRRQKFRRSFNRMMDTVRQLRVQDHKDGLAVLTDLQHDTVSAYLQSHPNLQRF